MSVVEAAWLAILAVGLLGAISAVVLSVVRIRRAPGDHVARFGYGWLATWSILVGLCCCVGLVSALVDRVPSSPVAVAVIVAVNLLVQPIAGVFIISGFRKLSLGLRGRLAVAWRRVPDEQLAGLNRSERRQLAWYCVAQGVLVLPLGVGLSYSCGWPLVHWALAEPGAAADRGRRTVFRGM